MTSKNVHLTEDGITELKDELAKLKLKRLEIAEKLKAAKEMGDLTENSAWSDAQDEFRYVENRIMEIERILQNAQVIAAPQDHQIVHLGSTVHLKHEDHTKAYTIVGSLEADPLENKISDESAVGKAVLGKKVGDKVAITTPSGTDTYTIVKVT